MVLQDPAERVALTAALSGLREGGILGLEWSDSTAGNLPSIAPSETAQSRQHGAVCTIATAIKTVWIQRHSGHAFRRGLASNLHLLGVENRDAKAILRHSDV